MTYSTVTIANKALILCGANTITALTDDTEQARTINEIYEMSRQEILTECQWSFATTRASLTTTVATTGLGFLYNDESYIYTKPSDFLRLINVDDDFATWRVEMHYIFSDTASLGIKYIWDNDDPSTYPPKFVRAFIDLLCSEIAFRLLNSSTRAAEFLEKYHTVSLPNAKAEDGQTGTQQYIRDDAWELAKYYNENADA